MQKETYNKKLINFLEKGTSTYTAVKEMVHELEKLDFQILWEEEEWNLKPGKYLVTRNNASLIAFQIGKNYQNGFSIITTHSDTPALLLKPQNEIYENGYLKCNVQPYGGLLNYGWFDRPLSLAGKVITKKENTFKTNIVDFKKPLLLIPSIAIHQNAQANTNLNINEQVDLIPIIDIEKKKDVIKELLYKNFHFPKKEICEYDLHVYNLEKPCIIGNKNNILISPRIDNLTSTFAALEAMKKSNNSKNINVFCSFNSEEVGSLTKEGADSNFLLDTLKRIAAALQIDISNSLANSFMISSDNTHAIHPNHPDLSDNTNQIYINKGIVISKEKQTTTDSLSASILKAICEKAKIKVQDFTSRNDMNAGSTLAGISLRHVSILSIDIGLAELAMHSANECVGLDDTYDLYKLFNTFFKMNLSHHQKSTKLNF